MFSSLEIHVEFSASPFSFSQGRTEQSGSGLRWLFHLLVLHNLEGHTLVYVLIKFEFHCGGDIFVLATQVTFK